MVNPRERILLVESDPEMSDLIARQTLEPLGYRVQVVSEAGQAIKAVMRSDPDVILADLNLPGLSGKDLLVALSSQALDIPVVVIAEKGFELAVIQALRLGAADYLGLPVREAEVVSAVERVLRQVRERRERENLALQLQQANLVLERRIRELNTIFAIGKAVTSITNQRSLLDKVVEGAVFVSEADSGWLLLREEHSRSYFLRACSNLPKSIRVKMDQPWEDGISTLVALSGEALAMHGEPLKRFKVFQLGQSILVVPVKVKKEVVGLLVVLRKKPDPFSEDSQTLLEAVADYASISLVNTHLFKALEERARSHQAAAELAQLSERIKDDILANSSEELLGPVEDARSRLITIQKRQSGQLGDNQRSAIQAAELQLRLVSASLECLSASLKTERTKQKKTTAEVNELARHSLARFQPFAHQSGITLMAELSASPLVVKLPPAQMIRILESLLSNAIKYNRPGGQVVVRIEKSLENDSKVVHVLVKDTGRGIGPERLTGIFDGNMDGENSGERRFGGLGISLPVVKDIVSTRGGKIWVESEPDLGSSFHITLPLQL
jgi:signal transduction histidine kinase/DNA-binding response OmpR family regulator